MCGHHVRDALVLAGQDTVRAEIIETDDDTARRIHLADNKLSDLAGWDQGALAAQLEALGDDFSGTGFTAADASKIMYGTMPAADDVPEDAPAWQILIDCDSEEQQSELLQRFADEGLAVRALIRSLCRSPSRAPWCAPCG